MTGLVIDISEFIANPISTGIQRVVRQLVLNWPEGCAKTFVFYAGAFAGFVEVPPSMLKRFMAIDNTLAHEDVRKLAALLTASMPKRRIPLDDIRRILIPEVFFDGDRISYYRSIVAEAKIDICMIVYDFKPFTNPAAFRVDFNKALHILPYLSLTRSVRRRAFISTQTGSDFADRIARSVSPDDCVIALGSDSLPIEKQSFDPNKKDLLCIGTFEGKKHQEIVFEAFRSVSEHLGGMRLVFAGYVPEDLPDWLQDVVAYRGADVVIVRGPTDGELSDLFRGAAATIFVSTNEGFGLPAIESLHLGVPVIVYEHLPSIEMLGSDGQIRLPIVDVPNVRSSLLEVADATRREGLWQGAAKLSLPTWHDYAAGVATWATKQ